MRDTALRPLMDGKGGHDYQEMLYLIQQSQPFKHAGFTDDVKLQGLIEALGDISVAIHEAKATEAVQTCLEKVFVDD